MSTWKETARKLQLFLHEVNCSANSDPYTCANYPCDLVNYPININGKEEKKA